LRRAALLEGIQKLEEESDALAVGVSFFDFATRASLSYQGDRWFHAASTIKVAILAALFDAVARGRFQLHARLHVRNRFLSAAGEAPYRVAAERDANAAVHAAIGRTMRLSELALHMIATSSNLASNLLLDLVGVEEARDSLDRMKVAGVDLRRGVEDEEAFSAGMSNRVTADGLVALFRRIEDDSVFPEIARTKMQEILLQQSFQGGIPAGLPDEVRTDARIAHKTGEISTVAHDAGLVYLPGRQPYIVAILTEWDPAATGRQNTVARLSRAVYDQVVSEDSV
jgi:beta-lactamase class A